MMKSFDHDYHNYLDFKQPDMTSSRQDADHRYMSLGNWNKKTSRQRGQGLAVHDTEHYPLASNSQSNSWNNEKWKQASSREENTNNKWNRFTRQFRNSHFLRGESEKVDSYGQEIVHEYCNSSGSVEDTQAENMGFADLGGLSGRKRPHSVEGERSLSKSLRAENFRANHNSSGPFLDRNSSNAKFDTPKNIIKQQTADLVNKQRMSHIDSTVLSEHIAFNTVPGSISRSANVKAAKSQVEMRQSGIKNQANRSFESSVQEDEGVLARAEKLCKELREKRQKVSQVGISQNDQKQTNLQKSLDDSDPPLNSANSSCIKDYLSDSSLTTSNQIQITSGLSSSFSSKAKHFVSRFSSESIPTLSTKKDDGLLPSNDDSQKSIPAAVSASSSNSNDIARIRLSIESSVVAEGKALKVASCSKNQPSSGLSSPASSMINLATSPNSAATAPGKLQLQKETLSKAALAKMVNAPRSRTERVQLARMLHLHTNTMTRPRPARLGVQLEGLYSGIDCGDSMNEMLKNLGGLEELHDLKELRNIRLDDLSECEKFNIAQLFKGVTEDEDLDFCEKDISSINEKLDYPTSQAAFCKDTFQCMEQTKSANSTVGPKSDWSSIFVQNPKNQDQNSAFSLHPDYVSSSPSQVKHSPHSSTSTLLDVQAKQEELSGPNRPLFMKDLDSKKTTMGDISGQKIEVTELCPLSKQQKIDIQVQSISVQMNPSSEITESVKEVEVHQNHIDSVYEGASPETFNTQFPFDETVAATTNTFNPLQEKSSSRPCKADGQASGILSQVHEVCQKQDLVFAEMRDIDVHLSQLYKALIEIVAHMSSLQRKRVQLQAEGEQLSQQRNDLFSGFIRHLSSHLEKDCQESAQEKNSHKPVVPPTKIDVTPLKDTATGCMHDAQDSNPFLQFGSSITLPSWLVMPRSSNSSANNDCSTPKEIIISCSKETQGLCSSGRVNSSVDSNSLCLSATASSDCDILQREIKADGPDCEIMQKEIMAESPDCEIVQRDSKTDVSKERNGINEYPKHINASFSSFPSTASSYNLFSQPLTSSTIDVKSTAFPGSPSDSAVGSSIGVSSITSISTEKEKSASLSFDVFSQTQGEKLLEQSGDSLSGIHNLKTTFCHSDKEQETLCSAAQSNDSTTVTEVVYSNCMLGSKFAPCDVSNSADLSEEQSLSFPLCFTSRKTQGQADTCHLPKTSSVNIGTVAYLGSISSSGGSGLVQQIVHTLPLTSHVREIGSPQTMSMFVLKPVNYLTSDSSLTEPLETEKSCYADGSEVRSKVRSISCKRSTTDQSVDDEIPLEKQSENPSNLTPKLSHYVHLVKDKTDLSKSKCSLSDTDGWCTSSGASLGEQTKIMSCKNSTAMTSGCSTSQSSTKYVGNTNSKTILHMTPCSFQLENINLDTVYPDVHKEPSPIDSNRKKRKTKKDRDQAFQHLRSFVMESSSDVSSNEDDAASDIPCMRLLPKMQSRALPLANSVQAESMEDQKVRSNTLFEDTKQDFIMKKEKLSTAEESSTVAHCVISPDLLRLKPENLKAFRANLQRNFHPLVDARTHTSFLSSPCTESKHQAECEHVESERICETFTKLKEAEDNVNVPYKPNWEYKKVGDMEISPSLKIAGPCTSVVGLQVYKHLLFVCFQGHGVASYTLDGKQDAEYPFSGVLSMAVLSSESINPPNMALGSEKSLVFFSTCNGEEVKSIETECRVMCLLATDNSLFAGLDSGFILVISISKFEERRRFQASDRPVHSLAWTREGSTRLLCASAQDAGIHIMDAASGLPLRILTGHTKTAFSLVISADCVISGSGDRTVMAHNVHTGDLAWKLTDHKGIVTSVCVDSGLLFTAGYDKIIHCYDLNSRKLLHLLYGAGKSIVMKMAVHNNKLYTGNRDGQVEAWDILDLDDFACGCKSCSLVFGLHDHLWHHLVADHLLPNAHSMHCPWQGCSTLLNTGTALMKAGEHMRSHIKSRQAVKEESSHIKT